MKYLAAFVAAAVLANLAAVTALPWLVNAYVMHRIAQAAGGDNRALPAPRADAGARTVVRPSPDLLYTACVFDVAERPLRLSTPLPGGYVSIAGFAADTSNFFAFNDSEKGSDPIFEVVVARPGASGLPPGVRVVEAPSDRGLILFRMLITSEAELTRLQQLQAQQRCEPL